MYRAHFVLILVTLGVIATVTLYILSEPEKRPDREIEVIIEEEDAMQIRSKAFDDNEPIPGKYTCTGDDINPPLKFRGVPAEAKSLALIMDDPDAPSGTANPGWVHWVIYNMPTDTEVDEDSVPVEAVQGRSDFGRNDYGGPCPPSGEHHYVFNLYALDAKLDLPEGATKQELEEVMEGHILERAKLTGIYSKN